MSHCCSEFRDIAETANEVSISNNKESIGEEVSSRVYRGEYIERHAYPDAVGAEADPADDDSCIDADINDFDV